MSEAKPTETGPAPLHGLLAEYDTPQALVSAAEKVRDAGYTHWDTYTPFPIHGIEPAMGIKYTVLPWIVFGMGLTGLAIGVSMQWWMNAYDYPWIVSGKPFWSIPANVPVAYELTILLSAFGAIFGMLGLNKLPHPSHPLDLKRRFARATDDKFFLLIEARDAKFDEAATKKLLDSTHPALLDDVLEDRVSSDEIPRGILYGLVILTVASLVPFALAVRARETKSDKPRIHVVFDMDSQAKFKAQRENPFFEDGRAMRPDVEGAVAVGQLNDDDHLHQGKVGGAFARTFPASITPTEANMKRGAERFGVYCSPCHGLSGAGDGMVHERAAALEQGTWVQPTNLNQDYLRQKPVGELFNTVTHGVRNMPGYGRQIDVEDRWKILLYVRALERAAAGN